MSTDPRSRFGILSAEVLPASELLPLIDTMTLDERIKVIGKLRSLEVILQEHISHYDKWHPHHMIVAGVTELTEGRNDQLLDAKEASRRLGYSTRWLYKHADSLPFTVRQENGRLRFSKHALEIYLRNHRKSG